MLTQDNYCLYRALPRPITYKQGPLGTILLFLPFHHNPNSSILLLVSQPLLSILLLVESKEPWFYKVSGFLTNIQSPRFRLPANSRAVQKRHGL
jgi:hypothetical protein